jgi:serine/threonine protein kinase
MDNLVGQNLGRYHVIEPLGQGGMAAVYKAFDTSLERNVAIKIIRGDKKEGTEQNDFLKRFQREAKALAQLDHPYILKVLDYGEQDGMPYLVMPFIQGGTLKDRLNRPMPCRQAATLLAPVARALDYAHQRGIIHRDVKPANILISESGAPLLSDFGIAKIIGGGSESTQLTATGVGIGTPDYMAPEQWMGKADACTDIYSLGVVFFQMVTGRLPFTAETPAAVLIKHMQDPLPRPSDFVPDLPEAAEQVIFKALAKDPADRFESMGAFAGALERLAAGDVSAPGLELNNLQTIQATGPTSSPVGKTQAARPAASTRAPAPAPSGIPEPRGSGATSPQPVRRKGLPGWAVAVIVVVVVGLVALVGLLAGGALLVQRMAARARAQTTVPTSVETTVPLLLEETPAVPTQAQKATLPAFPTEVLSTPEFPGANPPFTSIEGLPEDIPLLKDNNGDLVTTSSQGTTMFYFTSSLAFQQVVDFYQAGMDSNGWTVDYDSAQGGMQYWLFAKGDRSVMISVTEAIGQAAEQPVQVAIILQ